MNQPINKICKSCSESCKQYDWVKVIGCAHYVPKEPRRKRKSDAEVKPTT